METLRFSTFIAAPREKVWDTMLEDATYREWTAAFHPGSQYEGTWETGSEMRFLGPNQDGTMSGMLARIKEARKPEFVSIEHYGVINNNVEDTTSDAVKAWTPAYENYTFEERDGGTEVLVEVDSADEYAQMFTDIWPKALAALKTIAER